jgi:hypothetical protein
VVATGVGIGSIVLALLVSLMGLDFFKDRNLIASWIPLAAVLAAGLGARRTLPIGLPAAAAICATGIALDIQVIQNPYLERPNWRGAAQALGPARRPRAVVVVPGYMANILPIYGQRLAPARPGIRVSEVVLVGQSRDWPRSLAGLPRDQMVIFNHLRLARYRGPAPITLTTGLLRHLPAPAMYQPG